MKWSFLNSSTIYWIKYRDVNETGTFETETETRSFETKTETETTTLKTETETKILETGLVETTMIVKLLRDRDIVHTNNNKLNNIEYLFCVILRMQWLN